MICQRCMLRLSRRQGLQHTLPIRTFTTSRRRSQQTPVTAQETTATNPRPSDIPAATSTSAAQPFSTPLSSSPERQHDGQSKSEAAAPVVRSTVPAGTVLKGLNFMKNKPDPIAMEDHEYPDWLWTVLEPKKDDSLTGAVDGEGDLFSKSKKQRRAAAKALRRKQALDPDSLIPKVPLEEQTVDLPGGDGTAEGAKEASAARQELTKAMRVKRRKMIKEANFLKSM